MRPSVSRVSIRHPRGRPDPTRPDIFINQSINLFHRSIFSCIDRYFLCLHRSTSTGRPLGSGRCHAPSTRMDPATHHPSSSARSSPPLEPTPTHRRDRDRTRAIMHTSRRARLAIRRRAHEHTHEIRQSSSVVRASSNARARLFPESSSSRSVPPSPRIPSLDDTRHVDEKKNHRRRHRVASPSSRRVASHLSFVGSFARMTMRRPAPSEGTKDTARDFGRSPNRSQKGGAVSCLGVPFPD